MKIRFSLLRHLSRGGVLALFCALPWLNAAGMHGISGSLFALDIFGWPFGDPAALLQALAGGATPSVRLLWGVGSSLVLAFFLGRVFCGWLCPYGLFSEAAVALRGKAARRGTATGRTELFSRIAVLALGIGLVFCGYPALTALSFPGTLSLAPLMTFLDGPGRLLFDLLVFPGTVLLLEFLSGERLWCRFCCPQGLLLGAAAWLGARCGRLGGLWSLPVRWQAGSCSCKGEQPCGAVCTLRVQSRRKGGPDPLRCSRCGDCIQTCADKGKALTWMR